jgi:hypothetical protein
MNRSTAHRLTVILCLVLMTCGAPAPPPTTLPTAASTLAPTPSSPTPVPTPTTADLLALLSPDRLRADVEALAAIQPGSGWRSAGTQGEAEATDYVYTELEQLAYLQGLGMTSQREAFSLLLSTEVWEVHLEVLYPDGAYPVPATALVAPPDRLGPALRFDSDGILNDAQPNPRTVEGPTVLLSTTEEIAALEPAQLTGTVALVNYALVDPTIVAWSDALERSAAVLAAEPAGLLVVTRDGDQPGESHGTFAGDASPLAYLEVGPRPVTLLVRLEDVASQWADLAALQTARLTWDADVFSPALSHNLVAHVPGADPSQAIVLTAHLDTANNPGAMDDAGGVAALLEVARVLDAARVQPAVDLYLVWFGAEESGLVGSYAFASTHDDLLDRTILMVAVDCPTRPPPGVDTTPYLLTWATEKRGDDERLAAAYLAAVARRYGLDAVAAPAGRSGADNLPFVAFDVPNVQMLLGNPQAMAEQGGFYYASHIHTPYDTAERAPLAGPLDMARLALATALAAGQDQPALRDTPPPQHRAVLVGSHTEAVQDSPANFADLGATLALLGLDVDAIPYGQPATAANLQGADLVVVLPVLDYPAPDWNEALYDEGWSVAEVAALEAYVAQGGLLVLTNSADHRDFSGRPIAANEDWADMNALAGRFGITYEEPFLTGNTARIAGAHPLVDGIQTLQLLAGNGVGLAVERGTVLATVDNRPAAVLVEHGAGRVLALADAWMLAAGWDGDNAVFWEDLGRSAGFR